MCFHTAVADHSSCGPECSQAKHYLYHGGPYSKENWTQQQKNYAAMITRMDAAIGKIPTAAAIAGAKSPAGIDGVSMLPALFGGRRPNHKYLYFEFHEPGFAQAVRMGRWKAVRRGPNGAVELYDLKSDLAETRDLAGKNPKLVSQVIEIMKREHVESEHWPVS